jgi:hypothetical protein
LKTMYLPSDGAHMGDTRRQCPDFASVESNTYSVWPRMHHLLQSDSTDSLLSQKGSRADPYCTDSRGMDRDIVDRIVLNIRSPFRRVSPLGGWMMLNSSGVQVTWIPCKAFETVAPTMY